MSAPIFADPVNDGAADPAVIWNAERREWWMFYTNRRPRHEGPGWEWIPLRGISRLLQVRSP